MTTLEQRIHRAVESGPNACVALAADLAARLPRGRERKGTKGMLTTPPPPIAQLFRRVGGAGALGAQNRLLAPSALRLDEGLLVFGEENQGVCEWGCEPGGDDPAVSIRFPPDGWLPEGLGLSMFLLRFVVVELVLSAPVGESAACLPTAQRDRLVADMRLLPFRAAPWPDDPSLLHARGDALCFECPNGEGVHTVWVGGLVTEDLGFLAAHRGPDWG